MKAPSLPGTTLHIVGNIEGLTDGMILFLVVGGYI